MATSDFDTAGVMTRPRKAHMPEKRGARCSDDTCGCVDRNHNIEDGQRAILEQLAEMRAEMATRAEMAGMREEVARISSAIGLPPRTTRANRPHARPGAAASAAASATSTSSPSVHTPLPFATAPFGRAAAEPRPTTPTSDSAAGQGPRSSADDQEEPRA